MKKITSLFARILIFTVMAGCTSGGLKELSEASEQTSSVQINYGKDISVNEKTDEREEREMNVKIGDYNFTAELEKNAAADELTEMLKEGAVTIEMDDYSGFEKVGSLDRSLTAEDKQTTTSAGDIVLYNSRNIVMFYGSNSWAYTRIGHINDLTDWEKALGSGSITAVFTLK